ncbi:hypothetical protein BHOIPH791_04630 [Bartonella henselae]|nr:hypothetical protein BH623125_14040 [Bartonella henselae]GFF03753.1 hypothetical protein BH80429_05740 [Bartonella henselae]
MKTYQDKVNVALLSYLKMIKNLIKTNYYLITNRIKILFKTLAYNIYNVRL